DRFAIDQLHLEGEVAAKTFCDCLKTAIRRKKPVHDMVVALKVSHSSSPDWFQMNAEPLFHDGGMSMVLSFVNINRRMEQERLVALHQARLSETARHAGVNILAGGLAHEINNPLAILRGYTDI